MWFTLIPLAFVLSFLSGCEQKPYHYRVSDGKYRPVNDAGKYTKEDIAKAMNAFREYYTGQATTDPIPNFDPSDTDRLN
jgi:hypothetical protein